MNAITSTLNTKSVWSWSHVVSALTTTITFGHQDGERCALFHHSFIYPFPRRFVQAASVRKKVLTLGRRLLQLVFAKISSEISKQSKHHQHHKFDRPYACHSKLKKNAFCKGKNWYGTPHTVNIITALTGLKKIKDVIFYKWREHLIPPWK